MILGSTDIGKVFLGSTEIGKAYLGSSLVYEAGGVTPEPTPWEEYYEDFTLGYKLNSDGELVQASDYAVSPFIAIPSGQSYITFDLGSVNDSAQILVFYDSEKAKTNYLNQTVRYRTYKTSSLSASIAYIRFSISLSNMSAELVRVRGDNFSQSNLWTGIDYDNGYDNVLFGCQQPMSNSEPQENLTAATTKDLIYIDPSTQAISIGALTTDTNLRSHLLMFDSNGAYSNYYTQNANPRTITDARWSTTWRYIRRNIIAANIDSYYVKNETTGLYLFKGRNVV